MTDPFVGRLTYFRVYSGTATAGSYVLNATKDTRERFGRIVQMHANHRAEITEVFAGDIAAAVGLKATTTGDTLCDEKAPIILESVSYTHLILTDKDRKHIWELARTVFNLAQIDLNLIKILNACAHRSSHHQTIAGLIS